MRKYIPSLAFILGVHGFSLAGDKVYFSVDFNILPSCPERRVIYVQPRSEVVLIKPSPIQERIVIIEKGKKWKKHPRWDW